MASDPSSFSESVRAFCVLLCVGGYSGQLVVQRTTKDWDGRPTTPRLLCVSELRRRGKLRSLS